MPSVHRLPFANQLLASMPRRESDRMRAALEPVSLEFSQVLYESGDPIEHVYFPDDALVSLMTLVDDHVPLGVGLVGREGMVGVSLALGISVSPLRALVQGTGNALRVRAPRFMQEFRASATLQREVYRYAHVLMAQVSQTAACNSFHVVEARLARWLVMSRDRARCSEFHLTHEFLAHMLGVRRVGITKAAGMLQQRKVIDYNRGTIRILDHEALEAASCRCYQIPEQRPSVADFTPVPVIA